MKFVDRESELGELREAESLSGKKKFVVVCYGLRRVGKTRLLLEFLKDRGAYFFVNKNKTSADLLKEFQELMKEKNVLGKLESLEDWDGFFEVLFKREMPPVVFDEFQNFASVEPSVFGIMQKNIDLNEEKPGLVVLSGSLTGLMKKLFRDAKQPLYGRIKKGMKIEPLGLRPCLEFGSELGMKKEEIVKAYGIFGGYPKYYVTMEDFALQNRTAEEIIESLLMAKNAPLEDEVNAILSQEFGARSGTYYSILEAIANGSNTVSAIAGYLHTTPSSLSRQLKELKDYFDLIELEKPYAGKRGTYRIRHPLMHYWFSQIYKNYSQYAGRNPEFIEKLKENLNTACGRAFERTAREFIVSELRLTEAARQWGKIPGAKKSESTYEIDLIGRNATTTFAFEFKWSGLTANQALEELRKLREKTRFVPRLPPGVKLGVVARKIGEKQKLREQGYLAYDLEDL